MTYLRHNLRGILVGAGLSAAAAIASGQSAAALTAREIFYAAAPPPAAAKPTKSVAPAPKAASKAQAVPTQKGPAVSVPVEPVQASVPPAQVPNSSPASSANVNPNSTAGTGKTPAVPVNLVTVARKPLGVRLSILKTAASGQATEVAPDTSFQPGDRVRLNIQVSSSGYLYIINRGSSGTWTQLFPSPDLPDASNAVVPGTTYAVPPDRNFVVSNPPGEEKLFVILSRSPVLDVQALTMDLSRRGTANQPPAEAPAARPASQTTIAQNLPPLNDAMVDRLRNVYARDLIIEKVDEQTPGTRKENAVYAVNPGDGDDTRVVLDAPIKHR